MSEWVFLGIWVLIPVVTIIVLIIIDLFKYGLERLSYYNDFERIWASIQILFFGLPGSIILIKVFIETKRKERERIRKNAFWWELKEYGGWK